MAEVVDWSSPTRYHEALERPCATRAFFGLNMVNDFQTIAAFGAGAFLIGKRALIPALLIWLVVAGSSLGIPKEVAQPVLPSIACLDIRSQNPVGWIGGFVCVIVGGSWRAP